MLATNGLTYTYQNGPSFSFPDLSVERSQVLVILGRSGKGKTTLLHLLAGLSEPRSGSIQIDSTDISALKGKKMDQFRGQNIGMVFQQAQFIRSISVMQNLQLARTLAGLPTDLQLATELLTELGIADKKDMLPSRLSVGEKQRAGIARALITNPKVVLADEPTSALDDENCNLVAELLERSVLGRKASLIIVTHDKRLKDRFSNALEI
jgi:ABC-type lipoprotein export system ATPase subunit